MCNKTTQLIELKKGVKGNPRFDFLFNPQSLAGIKFQDEMNKLLKNKQNGYSVSPQPFPMDISLSQNPFHYSSTTSSIVNQDVVTSNSGAENSVQGKSEHSKKVRKSRWGPAVKPEPPIQLPAQLQQPLQVQVPHVSEVPEDPKLLQQLHEQKELQLLEKRIRDAAASQIIGSAGQYDDTHDQLIKDRLSHYQELAVLDNDMLPRDTTEDAEKNDGVIENGTWEHRKRAREMLNSALKGDSSALLASGKHHISDFLPKEELDKFLKRSKGESVSNPPDLEKKIDENNIGYQMLAKGGWSEGSGLGNTSTTTGRGHDSIVNPVSATQSSSGITSAGVGVQPGHEVKEGDDEFESYRKRMMLSYRFRPNPLNNPRRDYY